MLTMLLKSLIIAVGLFVFPIMAHAEQMSISYGTVSEIFDGLNSLSKGYRAKADDKDYMPFSFSAPIRITMAKDLLALRKTVEEYNIVRDGLILELSKGKGKIEDGTPEAAKFIIQEKELRKTTTKIDLFRFKYEDLNLNANPISAVVLAQLHELIQE